ncbi:hypothetical protein B0T11DRAFT_56928 [Plectosphaerella cucumerina]|uniref:ABM domain-containing protein n=1 Tax=Plectosphaerella cucumerina TaxID=40658 RepID=A0A8K0THK8_9PEZI|nr:hypothetical protein B0T11DRAFT_56928 [Plectosphaerella cucumerina]
MDPAMAAKLANAVTERLFIPVTGGVEDWKLQLKFFLQVLKNQQGYLRTRWGPWSEDLQRLELSIGWISTEAGEAFKKSKDYEEAMTNFAPVLNGKPSSYYLRFKPLAPAAVINSPIVEAISFDNSTESEDSMRELVEKASTVEGCNGVASGYTLNEVEGKGKIFVAVIGWASLDASKAAPKELYYGTKKPEAHHVNFNFPIKGFRGL